VATKNLMNEVSTYSAKTCELSALFPATDCEPHDMSMSCKEIETNNISGRELETNNNESTNQNHKTCTLNMSISASVSNCEKQDMNITDKGLETNLDESIKESSKTCTLNSPISWPIMRK